MRWADDCVILSERPYTEKKRIVTVLSKSHGKWKGIANGFGGIQSGDVCQCNWNSRLADGLGIFKFEVIHSPFSVVFGDSVGILLLRAICELTEYWAQERDPNQALYVELVNFLENISSVDRLTLYALWELELLNFIGYGIDISRCEVTGTLIDGSDNVYYISPKTGKCVVQRVGAPYAEKLFVLPRFWVNRELKATINEVYASLRITGYFMNLHRFDANKGLIFRDMLEEQLCSKN